MLVPTIELESRKIHVISIYKVCLEMKSKALNPCMAASTMKIKDMRFTFVSLFLFSIEDMKAYICLLIAQKQDPFARAWCRSLSLLLRVLWYYLWWEEPLLHIPISPIHCLLHCRGWLCWHLCPQLVAATRLAKNNQSQVYLFCSPQQKMKTRFFWGFFIQKVSVSDY